MFSLRVLSTRVVFMLGPAANHRILVSHAADFTWRDGGFADLIPLLGDGLLTIDGEFHRRSRRIMLPAFHRERIAAALTTMDDEIGRAVAPWRAGDRIDVYALGAPTSRCASRCARCSASTPTRAATASTPRASSSARSPSTASEYWLQVLRGPRTPFARLLDARARLDTLIHGEIGRRRRTGERGEDLLSLLLDAGGRGRLPALGRARARRGHDDAVRRPRHDDRDRRVPLPRARPPPGRRRRARRRAAARDPPYAGPDGRPAWRSSTARSTRRCASTRRPGSARAARSARSPSRASPFPAGAPVNYSSYASHRLPRRLRRPARLPAGALRRPGRAWPKGAYVPFGARLAPVPRHALRAARDQGDRRADPRARTGSSSSPATGWSPPDAHARAASAGCRFASRAGNAQGT